ncbi:hypothetical protein PGTUg99_026858 [Puccinia graminis f. sp. tritici]|nr:hypothetical protein PGTUg99_026858 [Puccinia graminis f. sp. tritici]
MPMASHYSEPKFKSPCPDSDSEFNLSLSSFIQIQSRSDSKYRLDPPSLDSTISTHDYEGRYQSESEKTSRQPEEAESDCWLQSQLDSGVGPEP